MLGQLIHLGKFHSQHDLVQVLVSLISVCLPLGKLMRPASKLPSSSMPLLRKTEWDTVAPILDGSSAEGHFFSPCTLPGSIPMLLMPWAP
jgi:hypothetical protein